MYRYRECGLTNVWLANGYRTEQTPWGAGIVIDNVFALHRSIATHLIRDKPRLSGAEFRFLRKELDLSQAALAALLGKDAQSVARWEKSGRVPTMADRMLRAVYQEHAEGNARIRELIERLNETDSTAHEKMHFRKTGRSWRLLAA